MIQQQIMALKPKKSQEWRQYEKGSLLENGLALNQTASFIFSLCDGNTTVSKMVRKLREEYQVDEKTAKEDTIRCVEVLMEEGGING